MSGWKALAEHWRAIAERTSPEQTGSEQTGSEQRAVRKLRKLVLPVCSDTLSRAVDAISCALATGDVRPVQELDRLLCSEYDDALVSLVCRLREIASSFVSPALREVVLAIAAWMSANQPMMTNLDILTDLDRKWIDNLASGS